MTNIKKQAISGVRWTSISLIANLGLQILRLVVLARLLPVNAFGLMAIVTVITGFVNLFSNLGMNDALIQRSDPQKEELATLYWTNICLGIIIFLILVLSAPLVAEIYDSQEISILIPAVATVFLFSPWGSQFYVLLRKSLQFDVIAAVEITGALVNTIVAIFLAMFGFGIWSLVWGIITGSFIQSLLLIIVGCKSGNRPLLHFNRHDLQGYLSFGLYNIGAAGLNYFNSRIDQLVIGIMLGPQMLGYYSMAFNLVIRPITLISPVITKVAFPIFSQIKSDLPQVRRGYFRILMLLLSINAPILIGVSVIAPIAVPLIIGEKWLPAITVMQVLALYTLLRTIGNAGGVVILSQGRADLNFYWNLSHFLFIPITVYLAGMTGDLVNIALALLGLQILLVWGNYQFVILKVLGPCLHEYFRAIIIPLTNAIIMGGIVWLIKEFSSNTLSPWSSFIGLVAAGVIVYLSLLYVINKDVFNDITKIVTKF